jgi:hypothetical protein
LELVMVLPIRIEIQLMFESGEEAFHNAVVPAAALGDLLQRI